MTKLESLQKLEMKDRTMTVDEAYKAYHKITGNSNVDVIFTGNHYGYAIDNIYNQTVCSPKEILKQAHEQISEANTFKKSADHNLRDTSSKDILSDFCQKYYFWMKYPELDTKHSGPDEFRAMSEEDRVNKGYKLMIKDAKDMIKRVKKGQKDGNGYYYYMNNMYLTTRYQTPLTLEDVSFTISNALSELIYKYIIDNKLTTLNPRETRAVFDNNFQHDLVKLNWADNWANFGSPDTYADMNLTKQRINSIKNARGIMNYAISNHANIPIKDINKSKVFKYNVKDAMKASKAHA